MRGWTGALVVAGLLACSGSSGPSSSDLVGDWELQSIDGQPLPYRFGERAFPNGIVFDDALAVTLHLAAGAHGSYWRSTVQHTSTVPNSCCQGVGTNDTDIGWGVDGDSLTINALYPAGIVAHKAHVDGERLTWQLTRGGWVPDGFYVFTKAP